MPETFAEQNAMIFDLQSVESHPVYPNDDDFTLDSDISPDFNFNLYLDLGELEDEESDSEDFLEDLDDSNNVNFQTETSRLSRIQHLKPLDDDSEDDETEEDSYHEQLSYNGELFDSDDETSFEISKKNRK